MPAGTEKVISQDESAAAEAVLMKNDYFLLA
jgi:hypothetical protein